MKLTLLTLFAAAVGLAQPGGPNLPVASLKNVTPPSPSDLSRYVADPESLVALGKALFWDVQAGSDGRTACATCHFHAGADHRLRHQLSGRDAAVNSTLTAADFPFRRFTNPGNNQSPLVTDKRQVAGSSGVVSRRFVNGESPAASAPSVENSDPVTASSPFLANGYHLRQVTGRNSPSVINAVFNYLNFWDGRASNVFTGATPFGDASPSWQAWVFRNGSLEQEAVRMENASLASQAVGPALNAVEMSWAGRSWPELGRKMLSVTPLGRQQVSPSDSVLGPMANPDGNGLREPFRYEALIRTAFRPEFYAAPDLINGFTQMEQNFSLFWGLAIQAYESTLIANDSRVDQFLEGRTAALSALEQQGLNEFRNGRSQCTNCHNGAELTAAGWTAVQRRAANLVTPADLGFFRIGVRPIAEDLGLGGTDDSGLPLFPRSPAAAAGTQKTPGLRNVEFTGPYFHDGSQATLEQVLEFYARNGDFPADGNLGPGIGNIRLGQGDRNALAAFLRALTDDRVRFQRAPFDHPSICVPVGHVEPEPGQFETDAAFTGVVARDEWALVSAVGREGLNVPLQTFDELLRGIGNDGSRANTMTNRCEP